MIHKTAIIDKEVVLGEMVEVGAYAVIEKGVTLGNGVKVLPFAHIKGNTCIGDNTLIGTGAVIGEMPQDLSIKENIGKIYIGKNNTIREYVTINSSTSADRATSLGDNNFLMAFSHIAHDCKLANNIVVCNGVLLAGHIEVGERAFISGNVVVHQFVRIGRLSIVGGLSRVNQDVPPFMMVVGDSRVWGINLIGLRRANFSRQDISQIRKAYNLMYRKELPPKSVLTQLETMESDKVKELKVFILASKRGLCGPKKSSFWEKLFMDYPYFLRTKGITRNLFLRKRFAGKD